MNRKGLALLFLAGGGWHIAAMIETAQSMAGAGPWRLAIRVDADTAEVFRVGDTAKDSGMQVGDIVETLNGRPYGGGADLARAAASARGQAVTIGWRRGEQRGSSQVPTLRDNLILGPAGYGLILVGAYLTPLLCMAVGFGVAWLKPTDPGAWILALMMTSFSTLAVPRDFPPGADWPAPMAGLAAGWRPLISGTWGIWMALYGLFVPTRSAIDIKRPLLKWFLILPIGLLAVGQALNAYARQDAFSLVPITNWVSSLGGLPFWIGSSGVSVYFALLGYRRAVEQQPDVKRRLNLLMWGSVVSLTPIFIVLVLSQVLRIELFGEAWWWIWVPPVILLFLFPATLAYVILVHRAMDVGVVVRQGLQYALARRGLVILQIIIAAAVISWASMVVTDPATRRPQRVTAVSLAVAGVGLSRRGMESLRRWVDRKFFREAVDAERVLTELGDSVREYVETRPLLERVAETVRNTMHVNSVGMVLATPDGPQLAYTAGEHSQEELRLPLQAKDRALGEMVVGPKRNEEPFSGSDVRLLKAVAGQTALALAHSELTKEMAREAAEREILNRELDIAREVQQRLFPQKRPPIAGVEYDGRCRPALSIGGDYYDFLGLPGGGLGLAIGDVSGKGIPAALLMASLQASLRGQAVDGSRDVAAMMTNINRLVFEVSPSNRYATFFYGQYDPASRLLIYVNGGHNAPVILRGSEAIRLEQGGPVVGLFGPARYSHGEVELQPGDVFIGFTDGVSEAMNPADDEWGEDQLTAAAQELKHLSPAEIIDGLIRGADTFAAGAPQHDDMTVIVAKIGVNGAPA